MIFFKGKELLTHIDNFARVPIDEKDAKVMLWLLGTIEPHIVANLHCCTTAQAMWVYLHRIYHQDHSAWNFKLELGISRYSQGNMTIAKIYSSFINLNSKYSAIVHAKVPTAVLVAL